MAFVSKSWCLAVAITGLVQMAPVHAGVGEQTAQLLNLMYNDTRQDCGSPSRPAFLCSGVIVRALWPSTAHPFYTVSPKSQANGSVSASYLRKDAKFEKLYSGLSSGYIFDAVLDNPADHSDYKVLCAFPKDGGSEFRDQNGCGDSSRSAAVEKLCDQMGVATAEQWLAYFRKNGNSYYGQCAFDVREKRTGTAKAFYQAVRATSMIRDQQFNGDLLQENELVLSPWAIDPPRSPSLLSSFYTDESGVEGARLYQIQWYQAAKRFLPAVQLSLPRTAQQEAAFSYDPARQAIQPMTEASACERFVQSASWVKRRDAALNKDIMSLQVVPTTCGRAAQASQSNNFFNELVAAHYLNPEWVNNPDNRATNIPSMRRQLICHLASARSAAFYSLEPSRPNTTHERSLAARCDNTTS